MHVTNRIQVALTMATPRSWLCIALRLSLHATSSLAPVSSKKLFAVQVLPTKDSFDAVIYLAIMHSDTPLSELKLGHQNLHFEATERTGQLKSLVGINTSLHLLLS